MALTQILNFFFPSICPSCDKKGYQSLCEECSSALEVEKINNQCLFCGREKQNDHCKKCGDKSFPNISQIIVSWKYNGIIKKLIHDSKINGSKASTKILCDLLPQINCPITVIPPLNKRGHGNHLPTELAKHCKKNNLPIIKALSYKTIPTKQHKLTKINRQKNMKDVFFAKNDKSIKKICLIDDIMTTGSTIISAASALKQAGYKEIIVCVLATA